MGDMSIEPGPALGAAAAIIAIANTVWTWINSKSAKAAADASKATAMDIAAQAAAAQASKIAELQQDVANHRVEVARTYVTNDTLRRTEDRVITAIDNLAAMLRGLAERMDRAIDRGTGNQH